MNLTKEEEKEFKELLMHPSKLYKNDIVFTNGRVLKRSIVVERQINGTRCLAYPIYENGCDTGQFKVAWPEV